jgi:NAD(P)H-flavin reductase
MTAQDFRILHRARLVSRRDAGGGMTLLEVDPGLQIAASYTSPGQYVEARVGTESGYFVLAGEPNAPTWYFIMRAGGGASDLLLRMNPPDEFELTAAVGPGFPMTSARGRRLVIALGGTGIAAGGPLVRRRLADGDALRTEVLLGARTRAEVAIQRELDAWTDAGVRLLVCLSQDVVATEDRRYVHGYVQDVLRSRAARSGPWLRGGLLFVVGMQSMVQDLRTIASQLGLSPDDVLTNH